MKEETKRTINQLLTEARQEAAKEIVRNQKNDFAVKTWQKRLTRVKNAQKDFNNGQA